MDDLGIESHLGQRRSRWLKLLALAVLVAGFVGLIVYQNSLSDDAPENEVIRRTPPSTTQVSPTEGSIVALHQPFAGTPAAHWRDGIAGLRLPRPKAVGEFTPRQVTRAVHAARRFLSVVLLDRGVIERHDFKPALRLVAPAARAEGPPDASAAMAGGHPSEHAVLIDRKYPLLPAAPKVKGSLTVESGGPGILIIRANMSVAYAFDTPRPGDVVDPLDIVSVARSEQTLTYLIGPRWRQSDRGLWPTGVDGFYFSMSCRAAESGYLAPAYSEESLEEGGPVLDPQREFDPKTPFEGDGTCPKS